MNSSTSNSEKSGTFLVRSVLLITMVMLITYWFVVNTFNYNAVFAETNINAGLIRLQSLRNSDEPLSVIVGSSMMAKLHDEVIFDDESMNPVNMGIDGGSAIYAAQKVVESEKNVQAIVIEANIIMKQPSGNMALLDDATDSLHYKASEYIPVLRRGYRPVSLIYDALKRYKDNRDATADEYTDVSSLIVEYPETPPLFAGREEQSAVIWGDIIESLQNKGTRIILVMLPDGDPQRADEYVFTRKIASKYKLPFVDLKRQLSGLGLSYSDGRHLTYQSARFVSGTIRELIGTNKI